MIITIGEPLTLLDVNAEGLKSTAEIVRGVEGMRTDHATDDTLSTGSVDEKEHLAVEEH